MSRTVLVTGGAGYIGSHTCLELLRAGHDVVVVDNLSNSSRVALARVQEMAGREVVFYAADIRDRAALDGVFGAHAILGFAWRFGCGRGDRLIARSRYGHGRYQQHAHRETNTYRFHAPSIAPLTRVATAIF